MSTTREGWTEVTDVEALTAVVGEPGAQARDKVRHELTDPDVAWPEATPFCVIATAAAGGLDASPKGDPSGRPVHVDMAVQGHRPVLALVVEVEELDAHDGPSYADQLYSPS